jgi:hypothetical protein
MLTCIKHVREICLTFVRVGYSIGHPLSTCTEDVDARGAQEHAAGEDGSRHLFRFVIRIRVAEEVERASRQRFTNASRGVGRILPYRKKRSFQPCVQTFILYNVLPPSFDHLQPTVIFLFLVHALDIREMSLYTIFNNLTDLDPLYPFRSKGARLCSALIRKSDSLLSTPYIPSLNQS